MEDVNATQVAPQGIYFYEGDWNSYVSNISEKYTANLAVLNITMKTPLGYIGDNYELLVTTTSTLENFKTGPTDSKWSTSRGQDRRSAGV